MTRAAAMLATLGLLLGASGFAGRAVAVDEPTATIEVTWTRPGVVGTLGPPSALRVGDAVTFAVDASDFDYASCDQIVQHLDVHGSMGAGQSGPMEDDGPAHCRPWTFIVPPAPAGTIHFHASVSGMPLAGGGELSVTAPALDLTLEAGGTPRPFTTNYPTQSWWLLDILGGTAPSFNVDLVFQKPFGATACSYTINGNLITQVTAAPQGSNPCTDWQVNLPDWRAAINAAGPFEAPWDGEVIVRGSGPDPVTGAFLQGYAITQQAFFDGAGTEGFESNLPAAMLMESRSPHYILAGDTVTLDPEVRSVEGDGQCIYGFHGPSIGDDEEGLIEVRPFADGDCEPVTFAAPLSGVYQAGVTVNTAEWPGVGAGIGIWAFDPMPLPTLEVDPASAGAAFDVTSSVAAGEPAEFEFGLDDGGTVATLNAASTSGSAGSCSSGLLDFESNERTAAGECLAGTQGSYELSVRFLDITGAARERTTTVHVLPPGVNPTDIIGHPFETEIRWMYAQGIAGGCASNRFCPDATVTRAQMASFLDRALDLPATSTDFFTDDNDSIHEAAINRVAAARITGGCAANRFCPGSVVTRAQMASFLSRALALSPTLTDFFTDDEGSIHEGAINRLAAAKIAGGCAANRFCPSASVTRGQMAAFLYRALGR